MADEVPSLLARKKLKPSILLSLDAAHNPQPIQDIPLTIHSNPEMAASFYDLKALKWARENGRPWDASTCAWAAMNGHLEVLKWARENGCPWDETTCQYAAENGHLEVLEWARDNGCPE